MNIEDAWYHPWQWLPPECTWCGRTGVVLVSRVVGVDGEEYPLAIGAEITCLRCNGAGEEPPP
jgi:hypothetical protein